MGNGDDSWWLIVANGGEEWFIVGFHSGWITLDIDDSWKITLFDRETLGKKLNTALIFQPAIYRGWLAMASNASPGDDESYTDEFMVQEVNDKLYTIKTGDSQLPG